MQIKAATNDIISKLEDSFILHDENYIFVGNFNEISDDFVLI